MFCFFLALAMALVGMVPSPFAAGKQTLVLKLKQPLRPERVKVRVPSVNTLQGERRDLEILLPLGSAPAPKDIIKSSNQVEVLTLGLNVKHLGKNTLLIGFTLPKASTIEVVLLDSYGKTLALVASGSFGRGKHMLPTFSYPASDQNGLRILALKIEGAIVLHERLPPQ
jgi:hypothetical protein